MAFPRLPDHLAREIAVAAGCDPRTVQPAVRGARLSPLTAARVLPLLRSRGLLLPTDANRDPDRPPSHCNGASHAPHKTA